MPRVALALILFSNLAFAATLVPPRVIVSGEPIAAADYALHFARVAAAEEFATSSGRTWGYDPHFLAGYPMGTLFDVNNKGVEIAVLALSGLGLALPIGFNLLVFLVVALPSLAIAIAARNFRLPLWQQVVAAALGLALWTGDSQVGMTWRLGVFASGFAMYGLPLSLSFFYRYLEERKVSWYLWFLASGLALSLAHPLSFFFFYGPVLLYVVVRRRGQGSVPLGALVLFGALVVLVNLFWLLPVLRLWHLKTSSGYHWIGDLDQLKRDLLLWRDSGIRLLVLILGGAGLWQWRRRQLEWVGLILAPALTLSALGYVAGEFELFRELETYRNNLVLAFLLTIPAAVTVHWGVTEVVQRSLPVRVVTVTLAMVLTVGLTKDNLAQAYAHSVPSTRLTLQPIDHDQRRVLDWLATDGDHDARVLTDEWQLGSLIPWYSDHQVIGGHYPVVWMPHNFANYSRLATIGLQDEDILFGRNIEDHSKETLRKYSELYNIGTVVASSRPSKGLFDDHPTFEKILDAGKYRIYRNSLPATYFAKGSGTVRADYGRLTLTNASRGNLILKYHWAPFLRTEPAQVIEPWWIGNDPVPFIRIADNRFETFVIIDAIE